MRAVTPRSALLALWAFTASASADAPATCARQSPGACSPPPPILLQTHQAVERSSGPALAHLAPLVPPFVAPPGASARIAAARQKALQAPAQRARARSGSASAVDFQNFQLVQQLRAAGYTCPGGDPFPPNDGEFEFDCRLWQASLGHSQDMGARNYFSHESPAPNPTDPFDRSAATGLATFSENIAAGEGSAEATLEQWKNSDGHCRNMMDPAHNRMGVAHALTEGSTYRHYWTQLFAADSAAPDQSCLSSGASPAPAPTAAPAPGTTPAPAQGGGSGGGAGSACEDLDWQCSSYDAGHCQGGEFLPWMQENCKQFCGFCG